MIGIVFAGSWIYGLKLLFPVFYFEYHSFILPDVWTRKIFNLKEWQNKRRNPCLKILRRKIHC